MTAAAEAIRRARLRVAERITDLVGETPIVRLRSFDRETPAVEIWAKCEFMNPGGSVKDRAAYGMITDAIRRGELRPGQTIIDSTSGNTGIAYSLIGGALGYPVTLVMPQNVSWARRKITEAFGTKLVFSDPLEGSDGAIRLCRQMVDGNPGAYFYPDQYSNPSNPLAHENTTGREIWEQTDGRVTHFTAGIGTSGTAMGTSRRLKEYRRDIECWAVEPDDALHGLEGMKHMASSMVPAIYHPEELDGVIPMPTEEAWSTAERLAREEGLLVGHSSGAAMAGAVRVARRLAAEGKAGVVVTIFPDRADRYFEAPVATQMPPYREEKTPRPAPVGVPAHVPRIPAGVVAREDVTTHPELSQSALADIYAHARRDYPKECCGIVFGPRGSLAADRVRPCANIQDRLHAEDPARHVRDARTAYAFEATDLFALGKSLRGEAPAKIVYHSHPDAGAYFSDTDQAAATFDGEPAYPVDHVVVDVRADGVRGAAQFTWDAAARKYVELHRYPA